MKDVLSSPDYGVAKNSPVGYHLHQLIISGKTQPDDVIWMECSGSEQKLKKHRLTIVKSYLKLCYTCSRISHIQTVLLYEKPFMRLKMVKFTQAGMPS